MFSTSNCYAKMVTVLVIPLVHNSHAGGLVDIKFKFVSISPPAWELWLIKALSMSRTTGFITIFLSFGHLENC